VQSKVYQFSGIMSEEQAIRMYTCRTGVERGLTFAQYCLRMGWIR
jgi:hypothetical protein